MVTLALNMIPVSSSTKRQWLHRDVKAYGQLKAGLLDKEFALQWVQQYITKFGGYPDRVTIAGESSGASSVMLHTLAYGGMESGLFGNVRISMTLKHIEHRR